MQSITVTSLTASLVDGKYLIPKFFCFLFGLVLILESAMNVQPKKPSYFISIDFRIQYGLHLFLLFYQSTWIFVIRLHIRKIKHILYTITYTKLGWIDLTLMWIGRVCRAHLLHRTCKPLDRVTSNICQPS